MNKSKAERILKRITKMGFAGWTCVYKKDSAGRYGNDLFAYYVEVSAEHGDNAADYYGEFRGGYPWINPKLEKVAKDNGGYWEWRDPGSIVLYEN